MSDQDMSDGGAKVSKQKNTSLRHLPFHLRHPFRRRHGEKKSGASKQLGQVTFSLAKEAIASATALSEYYRASAANSDSGDELDLPLPSVPVSVQSASSAAASSSAAPRPMHRAVSELNFGAARARVPAAALHARTGELVAPTVVKRPLQAPVRRLCAHPKHSFCVPISYTVLVYYILVTFGILSTRTICPYSSIVYSTLLICIDLAGSSEGGLSLYSWGRTEVTTKFRAEQNIFPKVTKIEFALNDQKVKRLLKWFNRERYIECMGGSLTRLRNFFF